MMDIKSKKFRIVLFLVIVIIVPIIYQQAKGAFFGYMQKEAMKKPVNVQTIKPVMKDIYQQTESAGRIEAKYSVDVVARINGWLQKRFFDEGSAIKKGQTLFLIEPDEYKIAVNNAAAAVRQNQAVYVNAVKELERAQELVKQDYVSKSYYDEALATRDKAHAALDAAKAQLASAKLNLSYTNITSPIDGKIGKIFITEGNLVNPSTGALAKIVSVKPIYVYFTLKSGDYLRYKKTDSDNTTDFEDPDVTIKLADGSIYGENGKIEFVNNVVDATTGTVTLRATFENGDELLMPGDFVGVTVKAKQPERVMLVPQSSVLDDTDGYYVWIVDEDNKAIKRAVKVSDEIDGNWVVEDGLEENDIIIGKGIQSIRMPGQIVNPTPLDVSENNTDFRQK